MISFYDERFLFLRIAILGFKYTISATGLTVILLVSACIQAVSLYLFAVTLIMIETPFDLKVSYSTLAFKN